MRKFLRPGSKLTSAPASSSSSAPTLDDLPEAPAAAWFSFAQLRRSLADTSSTWIIVLIALSLTSTALMLGLTGDDYFHQLMQRADPRIEGFHRTVINLFTFASGDREELKGLMNEGLVPWWVSPDLRFAFFRPLSSLTHRLDYALWPHQPLLMHLHSMAWFALLLFTVGAVHRRFSAAPWVAGFALFLYAVDDARATPVGWLCNRNAMIATIPALLGLLLHDRARRHGELRARLFAPLLFGVGLLGGEAGVQIGGYLVAYALFLDRASVRARLLSLLPYGFVVIVWRIAYFIGEYGVRGSGLYFDPVGDPLGFAHALAMRLPVLWLAQFGLPWADFWDLFPVLAPWLQTGHFVLALAAIVVTVLLLWPLFKRDPLVRFWAVGTLFATLPACAAIPNDRLLTATGVGGSWLIARFLAAVFERSYPREGRSISAAAAALVAIHALFSPLALPFRVKAIDGFELLMRRADKSIPSTPDIAQREVVLINPPVDPFPMYFAGFREAQEIPRPHYLRWLAIGVSEIKVQRIDEKTLNLRPTAGFFSNSSQWTLRDPRRPSRVGETVELADATFVVKSLTADSRPLDVEVRFREPLESPHFQWMQWGRHEYVPFRVPALGETVTVPAVDMKSSLLGLGLSDS